MDLVLWIVGGAAVIYLVIKAMSKDKENVTHDSSGPSGPGHEGGSNGNDSPEVRPH